MKGVGGVGWGCVVGMWGCVSGCVCERLSVGREAVRVDVWVVCVS